jgi:hypothetical protein
MCIKIFFIEIYFTHYKIHPFRGLTCSSVAEHMFGMSENMGSIPSTSKKPSPFYSGQLSGSWQLCRVVQVVLLWDFGTFSSPCQSKSCPISGHTPSSRPPPSSPALAACHLPSVSTICLF